MKKTFKMVDLDCAHCAQKMEDAINKLEGVTQAHVNFLSQKMTIETQSDTLDSIMKDVVSLCKKIEPDCEIVL